MIRHLRSVLVGVLLVIAVIASAPLLRVVSAFGEGLLDVAPYLVSFLGLSVVGSIIVIRRPCNRVGWMLLVAGVSAPVFTLAEWYALHAHEVLAEPTALALSAAWFASWGWAIAILPLFVFLPLLFPDGRLPSPRWRPVAWAGVALFAFPLAYAVRPGPLIFGGERLTDNPLGIDSLGSVANALISVEEYALMVVAPAVIAALAVRWRRSRGMERQQLKWFFAATGALIGGWLLSLVVTLPEALFGFALLIMPVAIGVAVLRYRLYEIDRIISRTLSYGLLTALLVGVYAGVVLLLAPFVGRWSDLAVAGATLAAAAAFGPLRRRVQAVVDRRFNRSRYDAQRTVERLASRLQDELHLDEFRTELVSVVHHSVEPAAVSLWPREEARP